ncbi:hypothetical protein DM872_26130 [Pseudomonas taiwanensis]|nr:hypothetical protein [Pseudomonas taiwanensis]
MVLISLSMAYSQNKCSPDFALVFLTYIKRPRLVVASCIRIMLRLREPGQRGPQHDENRL